MPVTDRTYDQLEARFCNLLRERDALRAERDRCREALEVAEMALRKTQVYAGLLVQYDPEIQHRLANAREIAIAALSRPSVSEGRS